MDINDWTLTALDLVLGLGLLLWGLTAPSEKEEALLPTLGQPKKIRINPRYVTAAGILILIWVAARLVTFFAKGG